MSSAALSIGQHSVTATSTGPSGTGPLTGNRKVNITMGAGQEIGVVDLAGDAQGGSTFSRSGSLYVQGWAADTASGAPVQTVTVFVDGISVGAVTLGSARPDVASAYNRSDYTNSGWICQTPPSTLTVGQHSVTATATGPSGTGPLMGTKTINVTP